MHELDLDQIADILIKLTPTSTLGERQRSKSDCLTKENRHQRDN